MLLWDKGGFKKARRPVYSKRNPHGATSDSKHQAYSALCVGRGGATGLDLESVSEDGAPTMGITSTAGNSGLSHSVTMP
jgi:hypothetical protein